MNFNKAAEEVFTILRSHNYECSLYDEDGKQVFEPEDARRFASKKKNLLVAVVDDGDNSKIKLYFRKDIPAESLIGMMDTLRMTATKYNMTFSSREQDHDITPKDFATKISVSEARSEMNLVEGMYGTSRSSYLRLENARMIVRHSARINEDLMGARGRNINTIHIENSNGERYLFPTTQLAPARAMLHHVSNGGAWNDEGGERIADLARDYADMRTMSRHIYQNGNSLDETCQGVRETVRESMRKLRKTFESICRKTRYEDVMHSLKKPLNEEEIDLSETVSKLKSQVHVDECEIEQRVYETAARCIREADEIEQAKSMMTVAGIRVSREAWKQFRAGELSLADHLHEPRAVEGYRAFNQSAMAAIGAACKDPHMTAIFNKMAEEFEHGELTAAVKAFALQALKIVGWKTPRTVAPSKHVKELGEWMDGHTAEKAVEEHCGHCEADLKRNEEERDEGLDEGDINDPTGYQKRKAERTKQFQASHGKKMKTCTACSGSGHYDHNGSPKCSSCNGTGKVREALDEEDAYITQGIQPDDDDLTLDDVILPTDQGEGLKDEVTVSTVIDPDTGEEEEPSTAYIQRLKTLSGLGRNLQNTMY